MYESTHQGKKATTLYATRGLSQRSGIALDGSIPHRARQDATYCKHSHQDRQSITQQGRIVVGDRRWSALTYLHIFQDIRHRLQYSICVVEDILCQLLSDVFYPSLRHTHRADIPYLSSKSNKKMGYQPTFRGVTDTPSTMHPRRVLA